MRAVASLKLQKLATRLRAEVGRSESDQAQHTLMAADIKRFLERPAEVAKMIPVSGAPPGAPIGDMGQDWLARPTYCVWDNTNPSAWMYYQQPF